ncbi:MAG: type II toxin-antitoxin system HigB family toxin [Candidatus Solibacter usitatus]|nr:type II toxin-antitoxin system HigB family toxin [Candidatus Solibacter usitatus]
MRVIARSTLTRFVGTLGGYKAQAAVAAALDAWFHETKRAVWRSSADVKRHYSTASILDAERVVFNIKGNDYRLVTAIDYRRQVVYVKWIGSHAAYDAIDARAVRYEGKAN